MSSAGPLHTPGPGPSRDPSPGPFTGQVVVITGAGSGIGRAAAEAFARAGGTVALIGRRTDALQTTAALCPHALVTPCDVAQAGQIDAAFDSITGQLGPIRVAFNAAGTFGRFAPLHEDTEENFDQVVGTNLRGLWNCMRRQLAAMAAEGGGAIVNCSSLAGHRGHPRSAIYAATKHAVVGLSRSAAQQYAAHGVRVNVVSPGSTDTEMLRAIYDTPEELHTRAARAPMGRLGSPAEVAAAALWLASSAASYVTGQVIVVDGGVLAGTVG